MRVSASELQANLDQVLDSVLKTGIPVEIEREGKLLRIIAVESSDKLKNLTPHAGYLSGDPEDIVHLDWSGEWKP